MRGGDMNHGIGLSSSCAVHLHIPARRPCQDWENTRMELSTLQSAQSDLKKGTQTLIIHSKKHTLQLENKTKWDSFLCVGERKKKKN